MSRRRWFLLGGLLAACVISVGFIVPSYLPSPVQAEVDELRSCLELRDEEAGVEPLAANESKQVLIAFHVCGFDVTNARTPLLAGRETQGQVVRAIVKDNPRFWFGMKDLKAKGYLDTMSMPRLLALDGQTARVEVGQNIGAEWRGVKLDTRPVLRRDQRIQLSFDLQIDNGPPERSEMLQVKGAIVAEDGQTCVIGGLTRKTYMITLNKWPIVGTWQRETWYDQEIVVTATVRVIASDADSSQALEELSEFP